MESILSFGFSVVALGAAVVAPGVKDSFNQCIEVGQVCADGTVLAGRVGDSGEPIFTTPGDAAVRYSWSHKDYDWAIDPVITTRSHGSYNTEKMMESTEFGPFEAAQYCATLNAHGHSDWYLPSVSELTTLYNNRAAIGEFQTTGGVRYWSSTSQTNIFAAAVDFSDGRLKGTIKDTKLSVRCIR